jgi:type IV secretory pathway TraG/TraD family ATPase VirD4
MAEIEAEQRGGRLDPSLLMSLDEVTKVCTAPVPELSADAGGRGIVLDIATQSIAAIKETWGDNGASMLITNCNAVLVGKGCKDPDDLQRWEDLSGKRWENQETVGKDGETKSITRNRVPVFSQSDIAQLRYRRVIAFGLGPPILIKTPRPKRRHR